MSEPKREQPHEIPRLAVTEVVYHFVPGQNPVALPARVKRRLATDEQCWGPRRITVGDQWQRLETGWVERCSMLRVVNEEKADDPGRTVELGRGTSADAIEVEDAVPPGESVRRMPPCLKALWLRCRQGRAAVTVLAIPE